MPTAPLYLSKYLIRHETISLPATLGQAYFMRNDQMGIVPVHHIYLRELVYGDWQIEHLCVFSFSANIGVPGKTQGCMFTPVQVEVNTYEPEKVGGKTKFPGL